MTIEHGATASIEPGSKAAAALTPVASAFEALMAGLAPVAPREMTFNEAEGRILAETVRVPGPIPPRTIALRPGWAVAARDVVGASSYGPAFLPGRLRSLAIGDELPSGTDAVLPPEAASHRGALAEVTEAVAPGEGVRRRGEDAPEDFVVASAGRPARARDLAVAAAAGLGTCMVREPVVRLCAIEPANPAAAFWFFRGLEKAGARVESETLAGRNKVAVADALSHSDADLVVLVGSAGSALDVLAEAGSVIAARLALRPGEGAGCGFVRRTPAIFAPPRLEVALAVFLTLVRPCLDRLAGAATPRPLLRGRLTRKIASGIGLTEIALLRGGEDALEPLAVADLTLSAIVAAEAWLAVPPESEGFAAGETVEALAL